MILLVLVAVFRQCFIPSLSRPRHHQFSAPFSCLLAQWFTRMHQFQPPTGQALHKIRLRADDFAPILGIRVLRVISGA